jgi:hypothetical protein
MASDAAGCRQALGLGTSAPVAAGGGIWLTLLCLTLLGYALLGRGWAYLGVPPVFIGEVVLVYGVLTCALYGRWHRNFDQSAFWFVLLLVSWGLVRIWPDLSRYGADALRDAAIWGYSAFALIVFSSILAQPRRLAALVHRYRLFSLIFLASLPVVWFIVRIYPRPPVPNWPWVDVPVISAKGGDVMVHSAGILAFWVAGLGGSIRFAWVVLLICLAILVGVYDRAGLLSFLAVYAACLFFKPGDRTLWRLLALGVCGLVVLAATEIRVDIPGRERSREISFEQFVSNLTSVVGSTRTGDLDETKEWRLQWWGDILDYTVHGKYFWTGKGFGINLADDDGYQVEEDGSLRNPHNGHLTMLARGGVPGFALWVMVQLSWACSLLGGYLRSQRAGHYRWAGLFFFLLAYWMAFMINTSFDVFMEGPMGGIWFWTIYGVGLAALWLYKHNPAVLAEPLPAGDRP